MENKTLEQLKEQYADFIGGLSAENKAKVDACKSVEELTALIDEYDGELPDDMVEAVAGGKKPDEPPHECTQLSQVYYRQLDTSTVYNPSGRILIAFDYRIMQCNQCGAYKYYILDIEYSKEDFASDYANLFGSAAEIQQYL